MKRAQAWITRSMLLALAAFGVWLVISRLDSSQIAASTAEGCTTSQSETSGNAHVARAAFSEPLPEPGTNERNPFFYGVIIHGCATPTIDLRINDFSNNPPDVPNNSTIKLTWLGYSYHNDLLCNASGPSFTGSKPPTDLVGEPKGPLTGPATYTYSLFCNSGTDGPAQDTISITVQAPPAPVVTIFVNGSPNPAPVPDDSIVQLTWTSTDPDADCTASGPLTFNGPRPYQNLTGEPNGPLNGPASYTFTMECVGIGGPGQDSVTLLVERPPAVVGDIFAGGKIANLTVEGPAVVSAQTIDIPSIQQFGGTIWFVQGYPPSLRSEWRTVMLDNLARLLAERARPLGNSVAGMMNINPNNRLGGEVWRVNGDLTISGTMTGGRGTIIVTGGDVRVVGDLSATQPIGIVARDGNITIEPSAKKITNVYFYAPALAPNGIIRFNDDGVPLNDLSAEGSFIGNSFIFTPRRLEIRYTTNVALNPPPGFISFILPTILERAP